MSGITKPRNINNLSKPDAYISPRHDCFWQCWIHAKLNFQCVHRNISRKQTVKFHNTPTHICDSLRGLAGGFAGDFLAGNGSQCNWGPNHCFKNCAAPKVTAATSITEQKYSKQTTRDCVNESARQFKAVKPALTFTAPKVRYKKPGCYSSIDDIMQAIVKSATRNDNEKLLPPTIQHPTDTTSRSTNISWKADRVTQELHVKFWGNLEQNGLVIRAKSQDLKNILGLTTIIDCQDGEQRQESKKNFDGNCQDHQQNQRDIAVVKNSGQWPVVTWKPEVTQCFCIATWFKMRSWVTHKLRCCVPFPLKACHGRTNEKGRKWTTGVFQTCSGSEYTNHNFNQSLWLWPMKWVKGCLFWAAVAQALLWHLGPGHVDENDWPRDNQAKKVDYSSSL